MATLQQILEEQNLEAKIDKRIEKCTNFFLKKKIKKFKQVYTRKEADAIILFKRDDLLKYTLFLNEQLNSNITKLEVVYKCRFWHNSLKQSSYSFNSLPSLNA